MMQAALSCLIQSLYGTRNAESWRISALLSRTRHSACRVRPILASIHYAIGNLNATCGQKLPDGVCSHTSPATKVNWTVGLAGCHGDGARLPAASEAVMSAAQLLD